MFDRFRLLFRLMLKEEWRMHSTLFNGARFAMLPILLMALTVAGAATLAVIGVEFAMLGAGVIALAFLFGLQTGTIGFETRDGAENVLGDATFLMFSARTLPVSNRFTVGAFLVKDMVYYAFLFICPIVFGTYLGHELAVSAAQSLDAAVLTLSGMAVFANVWLAATLAFLFGVSLSLVASGEIARNMKRGGVALVTVLVLVLAAVSRVSRAEFTELLTAAVPPFSALQLLAIGVATGVVCLIGVLRFSPTDSSSETPAQTRNEFSWVYQRFGGGSMAALVSKMVMDVHRSSGGIGKLVASSAILLASVYVILEAIQQWLPLFVSPGIVFSVFLSVTAVPTYIWLNQLDDVATYQFYPVEIRSLFTAKAYAFVLLETPVAVAYYAFMGAVLQPTLLDLFVGGAILVGTMSYLFGITVYLTGFQPNESLFDSVIFLKFTVLGMLVLVPFLMAGFFLPSVTTASALVLLGASMIAGVIGVACYVRGADNWASHLAYAHQH